MKNIIGLAKTIKPAIRVRLMSGGVPDDDEIPSIGHNNPPSPIETSMPTDTLHPHLISQRLPTAVRAAEDPNDRHLLVNLEAAKAHQPSFSHNVNLMKTYNQLRPDQMTGTDDEVAEQFINHYKDNLLAIHDAMEPNFRERTRHWYVGANKFANQLADRHKTQPSVAAAALAATSPQKDWFQNASIGERIMDIHHQHENTPYTRDMEMTANRIFGKGKFDSLLNEMRGKTYGQIEDPKMKAAFIRLFDETYHDPSYRSVSPLGKLGDFVKTATGDNAKMAWGSLSEIAKGVRAILAGGSRERNSELMGERHKIRNFYNNILDPNSPTEDVTVDTHAVAGAHMMPYGANATPVSHNFKNSPEAGFVAAKGSNSTGVQGTYPFYVEAVRRAANERGVSPREMQSMTWEGARALFPDTFKTPQNIAIVDGIWKRYQSGEITAAEARKHILDFAGAKDGVIYDPAEKSGMAGVGEADAQAPHSSYQRKLSQPDVYGQSSPVVGGTGAGTPSQFAGLAQEDIQRFSRHRQIARAAQSAAGEDALPQSHVKRTGKIGALDVAFDAPIRAIHDPTEEAKAHFESAGISAPTMYELAPHKKSAEAFYNAIADAKMSHPIGSSVYAYTPKEYRDMRLFLSPDGKAGFALKGDDIVSVFNHSQSDHRNISNSMLNLAVQQGGRKLDAFDTVLPHIYSRNKFKVVSRLPWDDSQAPSDWSHENYQNFNGGRPDVVFMAYDPNHSKLYDGREGDQAKNYTNAVSTQSKAVAKANKDIAKAAEAKKIAKAYGGLIGYDDGGFIPHGDPRREANLNAFDPIRDESGAPRVFYHGTKSKRDMGSQYGLDRLPSPNIKEFRTKSTEMGAHFGTKEQSHDSQFIGEEDRDRGQIYPVHLSIKNPIRLRDMGKFNRLNVLHQLQEMGHSIDDDASHLDIQDYLKSIGHDGIVYLNRREGLKNWKKGELSPQALNPANDKRFKEVYPEAQDSYIAFDPQQIKSALGNNGNFDKNSPNIHEARGGPIGYGDGGDVKPEINNPMSVFPKPQRMFGPDEFVAGGQYLSMPDKQDMTGHKSAAASIGVHPGGKPYFTASRDKVDETGSPGRGSAMAKTNLFKQKAGWQWKDAPEGHEDTNTIVSVEHRGKHHYALNAHFPKGVDFARYENSPSEPRLRPTTQGNVELGPQAGTILVRGREHPVYHHVIVKADGGSIGYANGGHVSHRPHYGFGGEGEGPEAGSTGSAAGNSYGGSDSSSSGGIGSDSVADNSGNGNDGGSGFTGGDGGNSNPFGGNGNGRDSSPSLNFGQTGMAAFGNPAKGFDPNAGRETEQAVAGSFLDSNVFGQQDLAKQYAMAAGANSPMADPFVGSSDPEANRMIAREATPTIQVPSNMTNAQIANMYRETVVPPAASVAQTPQGQSLEDIMGTNMQVNPLYSGMDLTTKIVPNSATVDVAKAYELYDPVLASQKQVYQGLIGKMTGVDPITGKPVLGDDGQPVKATGTWTPSGPINQETGTPPSGVATWQTPTTDLEAYNAAIKQYQPSFTNFQRQGEVTDATTNWGSTPQAPSLGPAQDVSMGVAPQGFGDVYGVSAPQAQGTPPAAIQDRAGSMGSMPPDASVGRQNYTSQPPQSAPAERSEVGKNFDRAFAAAAARGEQTFEWTNPVTGQTGTYAVRYRKSGGRTPYSSTIVEHVLNKISAPPPALDPRMVAKRGRPY